MANKSELPSMREITHHDYLNFIKTNRKVAIENKVVEVGNRWKITRFGPNKEYQLERETVWSFPNRGDWATHIGNYRGNWAPFIPRNLILKLTKPGDWVLDQMVGSGTTAVECKLLGRNGIFVDINPDAIMVTRDRLNFQYTSLDPEHLQDISILTYVGDARNLDKIPYDIPNLDSNYVDLIATHPPYAGIIKYSKDRVPYDLSSYRKLEEYLSSMHKVAEECMRVLKPGGHCAILIGDTRKHRHYIPISTRILMGFLDVGFVIREDVIKLQWKTTVTRQKWRSSKLDFYRIAHEHLYIFRKPTDDAERKKYKLSMKWW